MQQPEQTNIKPLSLKLAFFTGISAIAVIVGLMLSNINNPVAGHTHVWNQLTTLATIDSIKTDWQAIFRPIDTVFRVPDQNLTAPLHGNDRFVLIEEFPLYHFLAAHLAKLTNQTISASHIVSIFFWFYLFIVISIYSRKQPNNKWANLAPFIYATSFPFAYYGQAIMSDIAMTALITHGALVLLNDTSDQKLSYRSITTSAVLFCLASLFKSYAVVFSGVIPLYYLLSARRKQHIHHITFALLAIICAAAPIIAWHTYALFSPYYSETSSHSLSRVLKALINLQLYKSLFKNWFRFLGPIAGLVLFVWLFVKKQNSSTLFSALIKSWLLCGLVYLLINAEKLIDHDYYFLPIAIPLFLLFPFAFTDIYNAINKNSRLLGTLLLWSIVVSAGLQTIVKLRPSFDNNSDVFECAKIIQNLTPSDKIIASWTDNLRYNALSYYSKRQAVNVEELAIPLKTYSEQGATTLAVDVDPKKYKSIKPWIMSSTKKPALHEDLTLKDKKGRPRVCALFDISQLNRASSIK